MNRHSAFSLVELLCTVAILLIVTVLIVGRGKASAQKRARIRCENNLEKIYLALGFYAADNKGAYPFLAGATSSESVLTLLVPRSTAMTEIFICPGSKDKGLPEGESFGTGKISYAYYMGRGTNDDPGAILVSDWQVNDLPKTTGQQLFSADGRRPGNNHGKTGGNLLQLGGSVQFAPPVADRDLAIPSKGRLLNPR